MGKEHVLFHNHEYDGFRYHYPLIQYKRIHSEAAIVCIGEGTEAIGRFFATCNFDVNIGNHSEHLEVSSVKADKACVQTCDDMFTYRIRKWLPLNKENYEQYLQIENIAEKCVFLERMLVGNILSFGKGVGLTFDKQIVCKITDILNHSLCTYKGVKMMCFDVEFKANVLLPDYIGLGKGVSIGKGMLTRWNCTQND